MNEWNRNPLRVSENRKYLMEGEEPFFWLGDTAWLMLQKLDEESMYTYLRNRKEKGYNVIQTVLVHTLPGVSESGCSLAPGIKNVTEPAYWEFVEKALDMAKEMGLYLGLLPAWGSLVKDGVLNEENIGRYAEFLGSRFEKYPNIIWILGGDVRRDAGAAVFREEAEILKKHNPERLVTYHPFGRTSSSLWFHEEKWLDFNMYQSGHRRYDQASLGEWDDNAGKETFFGEDSWKYVERDHGYDTMKPTLDGEPSYEGIPKLLQLVGLENTGNKKVKNFSLGMRQRLGIAVALAGDPDFLVLDEPVNGLDPQGIIEIRELILKLNREYQITVLISSHILDELSRLATHYGFIDRGQMVKEISAKELEAACQKCVRLEVTDVKILCHLLDEMAIEYTVLSDKTADVYAKVNVSKLTMALSKENCELISMQERDESLESYYVSLIGGKDHE
mgnify:CR=1 FL=1